MIPIDLTHKISREHLEKSRDIIDISSVRSSMVPHDAKLSEFDVIGEFDMRKFWNPNTKKNNEVFLTPVRYILKKYNTEIIIWNGFQTDAGSVPQIAWTFVGDPFATRATLAYYLHDALWAIEAFDRKTCDWILLEFLQELGVNWWTRNHIWAAVKTFGGSIWNEHKTNHSVEINSKFVKKETIISSKIFAMLRNNHIGFEKF